MLTHLKIETKPYSEIKRTQSAKHIFPISLQGFPAQTGPSSPPILCGLNTGQHIYLDAASFTSNEATVRQDMLLNKAKIFYSCEMAW